MSKSGPITKKIAGLRQRERADGSWRIWWEPHRAAREKGFAPVELDADRLTWSEGQAEKLNKKVARGAAGKAVAPGGRSIDALIHDYQSSLDYKHLAEKTKASYRINLNAIAAKWGDAPVAQFTKPVMRTWYEALFEEHGASWSKAIIRMFSILMSHAEIRGWRPEGTNPCFNLKMQEQAPRRVFARWEEFDALVAAAEELGWEAMAAAIRLATLQGQRKTDLITAKAGDFSTVQIDGDPRLVWSLRRSKRGTEGMMPIHAEACGCLVKILEARKAAPAAPLLVDERTGRAYDEHLFSKRWGETRAHAAKTMPSVKRLQFRDLRRTFGVWGRAGGASKEDVGDVLGNSAASDWQLGDTYMPSQLTTTARAVAAIKRPEREN
ncbi:MAG: hypothetical protein AAFR53_12050 [Pseudomonadota bacterium]